MDHAAASHMAQARRHRSRYRSCLHDYADFDGFVRLDHAAIRAHAVALGRRCLDLERHRILRGILQEQALLQGFVHLHCQGCEAKARLMRGDGQSDRQVSQALRTWARKTETKRRHTQTHSARSCRASRTYGQSEVRRPAAPRGSSSPAM